MARINFYYLSILSLMSVLGVLGNYLHFPLFFGVDFIFGSIAVLISIRVLGFAGAIAVALIAGSYTYMIWGHPYALIIFTTEALVVSFLVKRRVSSLALSDIVFWLVIGMPLVWLFYSGVMGMSQTQVSLILLKQAVNGILNAIIATYLLLLIPAKYIVNSEEKNLGSIQLKELFFTVLLGVSLGVSLIIISYENSLIKKQYESSLSEQLNQHLEDLVYDSKEEKGSLFSHIMKDPHFTSRKLDLLIISDGNVVDSTFSSEKEISFVYDGSKKMVNEKLSIWMPKRNQQPFMLWWKHADYFVKHSLSQENTDIYLIQNARFIIVKVQRDTLRAFEVLFVLMIVSGLIAYFISKALAETIGKLTLATRNLPEKLKSGQAIYWPKSKVVELSQLSQQAEIMSNNIAASFHDVSLQVDTLLESSVDSIIVINDEGEILSFNHAAEILFGYRPGEVLGENINVIIPSPHKDKHDLYLSNFKSADRLPLYGKRVELEGQNKDGSLVSIEMSLTKTKLNNQDIYTAIITDISERKINEQLKRDFISTVSHELRTPLTAIKGSVEIVNTQQDVLPAEQKAALLTNASRNIERLTVLINDLLDFERLDSAAIEYKKEDIIVSDLLATIMEHMRPISEQKNIQLIENVVAGCSLYSDSQRLSQVIVNFVSNAIKFSPENEAVEIGCLCSEEGIRIYVKDNGDGIHDEFKEHIFERFTQADSSDHRQLQQGTGLGLAIAKKMTEDMGGKIGFDSVAGQGSTFYVVFPATK